MNVVFAAIEYFKQRYPNFEFTTEFVESSDGMTQVTMFPLEVYDELSAFFRAWDLGFNEGNNSALDRATKEYTKNLHDVIDQVSVASFNTGYYEGKKAGVYKEMNAAIIPSNSYNIEVFSVKSSKDGKTSYASVGYKYKIHGKEQFHFVDVPFTAPNLQPKNK